MLFRSIFFGELIHEFVDEGYNPTIPALSMSREDGLVIKQMLQSHTEGTLDVFYHPDFVAFFSSRGPVSPFYMKPDIVAPGAFINTTNSGGNYKIVSGTKMSTTFHIRTCIPVRKIHLKWLSMRFIGRKSNSLLL